MSLAGCPTGGAADKPAYERFRVQPRVGEEVEAILLIDAQSGPARMNRVDDDRQLSGHGIVIIVGNYDVSTCFTS